MKLKILIALALTTQVNALELRIGNGSFDWDMRIAKFMESSFNLDIKTISLSEPHAEISDTPYFYAFNVDIYSSDFADKVTTLMSYPVTYNFPVLGSINDAIDRYTPIPVPSTYKMRGFDLNFGLGYDFVNNEKGFLGIGVNTGLSMPVMEMKNLREAMRFTYRVLNATKTHIKTYKLGPTLTGAYTITPNLTLYGTAGFGLQTGTIRNDWIRSTMDVDGSYNLIDFGIRYMPSSTYPGLHINLGYSKKNWSMDDAKADMFNVFGVESYGQMENSFSTSSAYFGLGYSF